MTGSSDIATADAPTTPVFAATIHPHRSLGPNGFVILMLVIAVCIGTSAILFAAMGAWPVLGFLGLDILIVWLAFRANYRAARAHETVTLTADSLTVRRIAANGRQAEWTFNPYWAQLSVKRDEDGVTDVVIVSHGKALPIARDLSPFEKEDFASAFGTALKGLREAPLPG
ncbi:MAG: DUF2244 domain-containing protein [Pseudomonadota bacterium]